MKRLPWILAASGLSFSLALSGCGDDNNEEVGGDGDTSGDGDGDGDGECVDPSDPNAPVVPVTGDINTDTTWTCDNIYRLAPDTHVFVNGAVLTVEPGTTVQGTAGSALVIEKDARIEAIGTAEAPIVFTSNQASPAPGDWGGLVLLGLAVNNLEGGVGQAEGFAIGPTYGGNDDTHNCGSLVYVRVEYAGFAISEGNELNVITFYSCGSETTVHHVQTHMGVDDGFEMFGGTFDAHHLVATGAQDDSIDLDQGFRGTLQHIFIHQNPSVGDACYEISNQGQVFTATPLTGPVVCNSTCIGSGSSGEKSKGIILKEGTEGDWFASIFTDITNEFVLLQDESTYEIAVGGGITLQNDLFFKSGSIPFASGAASLDHDGWAAWVLDPANDNLESDPGLGTAWGNPNVVPTGNVAGNGMVGAGCEPTDYIGAVDPNGEDWTQESWINYKP